jgi:lipoprotein-anchoring transpeptidase ErfK/SrfK
MLLLVPAPGRAVATAAGPHASQWAYLLSPVRARVRPTAGAPVVTLVNEATPEGESNMVLALGTRLDADGREWVRIRLSILPNNSTGWVPRAALGEWHVVDTRLVVDRVQLRAVLYRGTRRVFTAPIGVGLPRWPTPRGEYYVRERLAGFDDPFYGPVAFGLSARSPVLTDWPGGGYVGIHGTDRPSLLPGRVSHGCIRLRNADILRLARLMPLGTPVTVR